MKGPLSRLILSIRRAAPVVLAVTLAALSSAATWRYLSVRDQDRTTQVCAARLRDLATALALYADDHDDVLPPLAAGGFGADGAQTAGTWLAALGPYGGRRPRPVACPSRQLMGQLRFGAFSPNCSGYAMNGFLAREHTRDGRREYAGLARSSVRHPALVVALCDARAGVIAVRSPDVVSDGVYGIYLRRFEADIMTQSPGATRHHGGANYAFIDRHVKWHRPDALRTGPISDGVRVGFGL